MAINDFFTEKQVEVFHTYRTKPFKIMILNGAVRSGKTFIDNVIFIAELKRTARMAKIQEDKHPRYILAGATANSIYNNVISELQAVFGLEMRADLHGHYHLFGVDIVPVYTSSITGLNAARGFTSYGAYVNEASLANEAVFNEVQNRCSKEGSHIICDTNPSIPTHWLKVNYIDNHDPEAGVISFNFTLDDNTFLPEDYVKSMKASKPRGMFYDRDILGLWVTGEGIIYRDFDKSRMMIDNIPDNLTYYCGVDWGFAEGHSNVITVFGDDSNGVTYLIQEYSGEHQYIDHWVNIAKQIQDKYGHNINFWCDSARPEYVSTFRKNHIRARNANKSVEAGIESVAKLMALDKFRVNKYGINQFLDEIYQYVWDSTKGVPVKAHDNVMDSMRYAIYNQHLKKNAKVVKSFM